MSGIAHHLVRRTVEVTQQHYRGSDDNSHTYMIQQWGALLILATGVLYMITIAAVSFDISRN